MSWGGPNSSHGWYSTCQRCLGRVCGNCCHQEPSSVLPCVTSCYEIIIQQPSYSVITTNTCFGGGELILNFSPGTNNWYGGGTFVTELPEGAIASGNTRSDVNFINTQAQDSPPNFVSTITASGTDLYIAYNSGFSGTGNVRFSVNNYSASMIGNITVTSTGNTETEVCTGEIDIVGNGSFICCAGCPILTIDNVNLTGNFNC